MDKTIFVFYTAADDPPVEKWKIPKYPSGWEFIGQGSTAPIGGKKLKYRREMQWMGPSSSKTKMIELLDNLFMSLKENGNIKYYKIRQSYLP